jgi:putative multicomponent Na+:H+ antiporter subunit B
MNALLNLPGQLDVLLPITALLPLCALLLVSQSSPWQSLMLRGILGSLSTLLYALLGAVDVALTEALVGTLLSTTLYAVAMRSSMTLRLDDRRQEAGGEEEDLLQWISPLNLRLRLMTSADMISGQTRVRHGWLEEGRTLVLTRAALAKRLRNTPGFERWQALGGSLRLQEDAAA